MLDDLSLPLIKRAILRRIYLVGFLAVLGTSLAVMIAYALPPKYDSSATILVEAQQIPEQLATTTVSSTVNERLQLIEQRLMTRENLLDLADRLNLYEGEELSPTEIVDRIRESTTFDRVSVQIGVHRQNRPVTALYMKYSDPSPTVAAQVANEMVTLVLEQNLRVRSERAGETLEFFEVEVARLTEQLNLAETELARFTTENRDALPTSLEDRRDTLIEIQSDQLQMQRSVNELEEIERTMRRRLDRGLYGPQGEEVSQIDVELASARQELLTTRALYRDGHPRVRRLENLVGELERVSEAASEARAGNGVQSLEAQEARLEMERQVAAADENLQLMRRQIELLEEREAALEASIERTPEVTFRLNVLSRRVEDLVRQLDEAQRKRAVAETGEKLEVNRQAERFEVIERAAVPEEPSSPNRPQIAVAGSVLSLGFGLGLALLLELLHRAIWTASELERRLDMRPLITVPYIETGSERRSRRFRNLARLLVLLAVVPVTAYLVHTFYLPLDLLFERLLDRTGLDSFINQLSARFGS